MKTYVKSTSTVDIQNAFKVTFIPEPHAPAFPIQSQHLTPIQKKILKLENFNMRRLFLLITDNPIVCICIIYFIMNLLVIYILYCDYHMPTSTTGS